MPRKGSKKRQVKDEEDEEEEEESSSGPSPPPRSRRREASQDDIGMGSTFAFSQQAPEASQGVQPERASDRRHLDQMDEAARNKAVVSLSRLLLFRALDKEPIDRLKAVKDAGITDKISSAAFQEASDRLRNVFGFELGRAPKYMKKIKELSEKKLKERYYMTNALENTDGMHSKAIHSTHQDAAIEKGLLLLVLAFIFCKGECHPDGSRWIFGRDLYRLLHSVDDGIPEEPPVQGSARSRAGTQSSQKSTSRFREHQSVTPDVDTLLEQFVSWDYLLKVSATCDEFSDSPTASIALGN